MLTQFAKVFPLKYTGRVTVYGKTFKGENFCSCVQNTLFTGKLRSASGPYHYVLYTANDSRGKLSRLAKNCENHESFPPQKFCRIQYFAKVMAHQHFALHIW